MRSPRGLAAAFAAVTLATMALAQAAVANHSQPAPDISKLEYEPEGFFKAGDPVPSPDNIQPLLDKMQNGVFNPSGHFSAFDNNVFEVLALPYRGSGDTSATDPYGNGGDPRHGYCKPNPESDRPGELALIAGECPNHQLEYSQYFERTMRAILGDFGATVRRYRFQNPGSGNTEGGTAINTAIIVPGADHPDESVIIGAHYDQTADAPASAWDSAEGHAQVIRVAKLMADYWRKTGTRPSATVKFVPWDAEESGVLGSRDFVAKNVVPGEEHKVRGYWNNDPCAGGYPAYRYGNPADRVDLGIQLYNPDRTQDPVNLVYTEDPPASARERALAFNAKAPRLVEQVFDKLDDKLSIAPGVTRDIFVSTAEGGGNGDIGNDVRIGTARPFLFSSDWASFEDAGIPYFDIGPDITGPSSEGDPGNPDGVAILHSPLDNLVTMNKYTGGSLTGTTFSEGWMKGMEMCSQVLSWGMLQPEQGGAQTANGSVVAYYDALPNEAPAGKPVRFDATGSYQYASVSDRRIGRAANLSYTWSFGDGKSGTGRVVEHTYPAPGIYTSKLTVRNVETGRADTMTVPITVAPGDNPELSGPVLSDLPESDDDGTFTVEWAPAAGGPLKYFVEESTDVATRFSDDAEGDLATNWTAEQTSTDSKVKGWRKTSDTSPPPGGNKSRSGASSYWTGFDPSEPPVANVSTLTMKAPIAVPAAGETRLSYWSYYRNDLTDLATVEVAEDDGNPNTDPEWTVVDSMRGDDLTGYHPGVDVAVNGNLTQLEGLQQRSVDLTRFAGRNVIIRFRAAFTTRNGIFVTRYGWYLDDIQINSASFTQLAETTGTSFELRRPNGTYAYRVRGVFEDHVVTAPSNTETIQVAGG